MTHVLLAALDPDQREVAALTHGRVAVIATAGSGKTRAITHRIAYAVATGAHEANRGLALTFTTKAAGAMRKQLADLSVDAVTAATFHSTALRQLTHFWPRALGGSAWKVSASKNAAVEEAIRHANLDVSNSDRRSIISEMEWAKTSGLDPSSYLELNRGSLGVDQALVAEVWGRYTDICHRLRVIDFEDVLSLTVGMLQQRPDIALEVQRRYTWFTVDEYQDVTPLQQALLDLWIGNRNDVCVVGDPAQTIYSFAGAQSNFLTAFQQNYPDATVIELRRTYRCPLAVVDVANSLMAAEIPELRSAVAMKSQVEATGEIHVAKYSDEAAEAAAVAQQIAQLIKAGSDPREIAVLIRINTMSVALESAFDNLRIPYTVKGSTKFFDRREIKQALLALKVETYSDAKHDLLELITSVCESFGWSQKPPLGSVEAKSAWESLSGLVVMADDLVAKNPQATLQDFMSEIEVRTVSQQEPAAAAVTIATMHAAKGLEWEYVFIPGLVEGVVPYVLALTEHNIAEERRLLYVAITRAKKSVWLSWPNARRGNQGGSPVPSRFLSDINATNSDLEFTEV
ncbi:MAG: hypothetical protein RLZZ426_579, partial [Actinomycetota bacterium]